MSTILIKNIDTVITCDDSDRILRNADILVKENLIAAIVPTGSLSPDVKPDRVIDAAGMICYPGLINTHHHLYQMFSRNLPEVQNMELFEWLKYLYEIWKYLDPASIPATVGIKEPVDYTIVNGRITVEHGHIVTIDEEKTAYEANRTVQRFIIKT